jgi:endonuclease/exonuclease/phosphatase family metal-dependent hydrolase
MTACGTSSEPEAQVPDTTDYIFQPIDGSEKHDVSTHRLCVDSSLPDDAPDPVYIQCELETWVNPAVDIIGREEPIVLTYNIERGHLLDEQIELLLADTVAPLPDIILMSEADRGCGRTGYRHTAREYAERLGMHMVYATEFVEVSGSTNGEPSTYSACEHGNAILSRYPLGNAGAIRHRDNVSWYTPLEDRGTGGFSTRLGGRITVYADAQIGDSYLHLYSLHFSSDFGSSDVRASQAEEIVEHAADYTHPVIVGGDTNAFFYAADVSSGMQTDDVTGAFLTNGYTDAHSTLEFENRYTCDGALNSQPIIDLIFGKGVGFSNSVVCHDASCAGLSDHYPVWTTVLR